MRTCIVFRGENLRYKRGRTSALECVDNWKETILDVIECDVALFTYSSEILEELIEILSPIHVCTSGYDSQDTNVLAATNWMIENNDKYDRFVLLRFDFMYRKKINQWPQWDKKGVILENKLVLYPTSKLIFDFIFIIDSAWVSHFKKALLSEDKEKDNLLRLHLFLTEMNVPLHLMYSGYYAILNHPLHVFYPLENKPKLDDNYLGEEFFDISFWNPCMNKTCSNVNDLQKQNEPQKRVSKTTIKSKRRPFIIFNK